MPGQAIEEEKTTDDFEKGFDDGAVEDGTEIPETETVPEDEAEKTEVSVKEEAGEKEPTSVEAKKEKEIVKEKETEPSTELGEDETVETLTQKYKSLQGMFKTKIEEAKAEAIKEFETKKPPKEEIEPDKEPEVQKPDDFVKKRIDEITQIPEMALIKEDAPDIYDAIIKIAESQERRLFQMTQAVISILNPVIEKYETTEEGEHFGKILNAHKDYETYRDNGTIEAWIKEQPTYKQKAYFEAYQRGTAQEVIDLITDFKKAKDIDTPSKKKEEKDKVPIEELEEIETVKPTRTSIYPRVDKGKDDFDAGFEAGAKSV